MHAYLRFIRTEMDKRGWTAADLGRASGLSRQHLSRILGDDRSELQRKPEGSTIDALAQAFGVSPDYVLAYVAEAMGFPASPIPAPDASALSDDELVRILTERLRRAHVHGTTEESDLSTPGAQRDEMADPPQPDGVTSTASGRRGNTVRATPFRTGGGGRTSGTRPRELSGDGEPA